MTDGPMKRRFKEGRRRNCFAERQERAWTWQEVRESSVCFGLKKSIWELAFLVRRAFFQQKGDFLCRVKLPEVTEAPVVLSTNCTCSLVPYVLFYNYN